MINRPLSLSAALLVCLIGALPLAAAAQEAMPWGSGQQTTTSSSAGGRTYTEPGEDYNPNAYGGSQSAQAGTYDRGYDALRNNAPAGDATVEGPYETEDTPPPANAQRPNNTQQGYQQPTYQQPANQQRTYQQPSYQQPSYQQPSYRQQPSYQQPGYTPPASYGPGQAYAPPANGGPNGAYRDEGRAAGPNYDDTYSDNEILDAGHHFFGKTTQGLAKVIAHAFQKSGRPNAYILGEEGGGAIIAGLRYGEGTLYTKWGEQAKIYWQGPSIGYDFGAEGAKTMILVYNLRGIDEMYERYAGVDGSAYLVGGVGVTFQKRGRVTLAPIRTGVGVRLGANVGYLKYSRSPTWNPF